MSYSFNVTASTKAEAKQKITEEFDAVLRNQPVHSVDRASAQTAAEAFIDVLSDPSVDENLYVSVSGWVGWRGEGDFVNANVSVAARVAAKAAENKG